MMIKGDGFGDRAEAISALADGELGSGEVAAACAHWRNHTDARTQWHDYQLIGDVLRSEDLASTAAHDSDFLRALRQRLDAEPVVLAPSVDTMPPGAAVPASVAAPVTAVAGARRTWVIPSAVAATVAAVVVGGVMSLRMPAGGSAASGPQLAAGEPKPTLVSTEPNEQVVTVANGRLIRDARLDRYLAAHQQWSGGSVVGGHAAYLRHASADASQR